MGKEKKSTIQWILINNILRKEGRKEGLPPVSLFIRTRIELEIAGLNNANTEGKFHMILLKQGIYTLTGGY